MVIEIAINEKGEELPSAGNKSSCMNFILQLACLMIDTRCSTTAEITFNMKFIILHCVY